MRWRRRSLPAVLLLLATGAAAGCLQVQEAAGCNTPGLLGCRDESTEPVREEAPPRPARDEPSEP